MKIMIALAALVFSVGTVSAAEHTKAPSPAQKAQQEKMVNCNTKANGKSLKGEERNAFMKECLSGKNNTSQQDKMKNCNAGANSQALKGDERKKFMSQCLKS